MESNQPAPDRGRYAALGPLGWDEARQAELSSLSGLVPGRIARVDGSSALVMAGGAPTAALFDDLPVTPTVGDWAAVAEAPGGPNRITALLLRRTALTRARPHRDRDRSGEQCLAANVDTALIVQAADNLNVRRLEREAAFARECRVEPAVVLTKSDLAAGLPDVLSLASRAAPGCAVVSVSAVTGEGLASVRALVPYGRTAVLLGASGVGKSTLTNRLLGAEVMATAAVRETDQHGRHTTTARHLHLLPEGGVLIDTPGLREVGLLTGAGVEAAFPEIADLAGGCRFRDCTHTSEPGCAVLGAVESDDLDGGRLESYRKLGREAKYHERKADPLAAAAHKKRWKDIARHNRQRERLERD